MKKKEMRELHLYSRNEHKQSSPGLRRSLSKPSTAPIPHTAASTYKASFHSPLLVYHLSTQNVVSMISTHLDC